MARAAAGPRSGPPAADGLVGRSAERLVRSAERALDRLFGADANPLRQLGALAFWLMWIVVASGFWIYALYETSIDGAWASVQAFHEQQPLGAGLMRSLHRYASDALVMVSLLHLLREALLGRFRVFRWYSWLSGVPLLWLTVASGLVGYWMVWDQRAQYVGTATLEWTAVLPGVPLEVVRNFLDPAAITDRFFSLLAFAHIGLPLLLLLGCWAHLQRLTRPLTQPRRALALGSVLTLVLGSLAWPALSMPVADLTRVPLAVELDWFYLGALPAADRWPAATWWVLLAGTALLSLLPWWPARRAAVRSVQPARVDPAHCNGCTLCLADCPYGAVSMVPHPLHRGLRLARVAADQCAGCGVCVGACPSATPFRRASPLVTGIDLPDQPLPALRAELDAALDRLAAAPAPRVLVLGCAYAAMLDRPPAGVAELWGRCAAQWPPVFVEYALRRGADGVLLAGCPGEDCTWRLGARWTAERLEGRRRPQLRAQVPRERVRLLAASREDAVILATAVAAFRSELAAAPRVEPLADPVEEESPDA